MSFVAKITVVRHERQDGTVNYCAVTVLTNGSRAASGNTREEAIANLARQIPEAYNIEIEPETENAYPRQF
jgi:hypothetical protein